MRKNRKFIAALDVFTNPRRMAKAAKSLKAYAQQSRSALQIAAVISPDRMNWPVNFSDSWAGEYEKLGTQVINKVNKKLKLSNSRPKALLQIEHSKKLSARKIVSYAKKEGADAIGVVTHLDKKKGLFSASFTETLIAASPLPVIAINAQTPPIRKIKSILFPTDFSPEGKKGFKQTVLLAKKLNAKIILMHKFITPLDPGMVEGAELAGGWRDMQDFMALHEKGVQKTALRWENEAKKSGVKVEFVFSHRYMDLDSIILKSAEENKVDMIAMTAMSGPVMTFFLGSVTRDVLKRSTRPVAIFRVNGGPR